MAIFETLELQHAAQHERTKLKESKRRLRSTNSTSRRRNRNLKDKTRKKTQLQAVTKTFKTDEDAVRKSPRKKLSLLFSKRKNSMPDSPVAKPKSKCILNDDVERQIRREWVVGSGCQIYSRSHAKWLDGKIVKIFVDKLGEWLQVEYCQLKTQIQRYCVHIRPLPQKKEKKPEECGHEIAAFFTVESSSSDEFEEPEESALELEKSVELEESKELKELSDILKVEALGMVQEESKKSLSEPEPKAPDPEVCALATLFRLCGSKFNADLSFEEFKQNVENFIAESPNDEHLQLIKEHMENFEEVPELVQMPEECISLLGLRSLFTNCENELHNGVLDLIWEFDVSAVAIKSNVFRVLGFISQECPNEWAPCISSNPDFNVNQKEDLMISHALGEAPWLGEMAFPATQILLYTSSSNADLQLSSSNTHGEFAHRIQTFLYFNDTHLCILRLIGSELTLSTVPLTDGASVGKVLAAFNFKGRSDPIASVCADEPWKRCSEV